MSNTFIAVEGQHDVEVVSALLESMGFHKEVIVERLTHGFCDRLINKTFPHQGDLHRRVPNPMFLTDDNCWVAVQACGGDTEIIRTVREALYQLQSQPASLLALGIVRDADDKPPQQQLDLLTRQLQVGVDVPPFRLALPTAPGEIAAGSPNLGIFIIPDNAGTGTIEDLLLECGEIVYPGLLAGARHYVENVDLLALRTGEGISGGLSQFSSKRKWDCPLPKYDSYCFAGPYRGGQTVIRKIRRTEKGNSVMRGEYSETGDVHSDFHCPKSLA